MSGYEWTASSVSAKGDNMSWVIGHEGNRKLRLATPAVRGKKKALQKGLLGSGSVLFAVELGLARGQVASLDAGEPALMEVRVS